MAGNIVFMKYILQLLFEVQNVAIILLYKVTEIKIPTFTLIHNLHNNCGGVPQVHLNTNTQQTSHAIRKLSLQTDFS